MHKARVATVTIEEHLVRQINLQIPADVKDDDVLEYAENKVRDMYKSQEIVLTADDFDGTAIMEICDNNGHYTDWIDIN